MPLPSPLPEKGVRSDIARAVNQLTEEVKRRKIVARPGQKVVETANGTTLETTGGGGNAVFTQDWFY